MHGTIDNRFRLMHKFKAWTDMDILKLLSCKVNRSLVVRQEVVIDLKRPDGVRLFDDYLMIWLVSDFCAVL